MSNSLEWGQGVLKRSRPPTGRQVTQLVDVNDKEIKKKNSHHWPFLTKSTADQKINHWYEQSLRDINNYDVDDFGKLITDFKNKFGLYKIN